MLIPCVVLLWSAAPAVAQAVYKCSAHAYSEQPCSKRVVRTYDAPVPIAPKPKVVAVRRLPGESDEAFATRKRRVGLAETDRDECARLDKRIPLERERLKGPEETDIDDAQSALIESQKRFKQLHC
jgi:hypothetical protein